MGSKTITTTLGEYLTFKNGKKSPDRDDNGCFNVFGSNGKIGKTHIANSDKNTIVIGRVGSYCGSVHFSDEKCWVTDNAIACVAKSNEPADFWFYLLGYLNLNQYRSGSGQPLLNQSILNSIKCSIPSSIESRAKIGHYLLSLDNKITLNCQVNQTLEQMAQVLFKSWFVDFDPVVDNALDAGFFEQDLAFPDELLRRAEARKAVRDSTASLEKSKPLPDAIRQLFPAAFEECAEPSLGLGGWVPQGWKPSNVGAEFDVTMGQSPPGSTYNEIGDGMPFFQGKTDFGFRFPSNRVYCTEPKRLARKHDTLISVRAPVGDINLAAEDCAIGRGLAAARHKSGSISFSYYSMNSLSKYFEVFEGEGTVFGSINQKDFNALPLIQYPSELITKFGEHCERWDQRIENITVEVLALTSLRDTLLPKLISGELRLDEIEVDIAEQGVA